MRFSLSVLLFFSGILGCSFDPERTTLGKDEKRIKHILTLPVNDSGTEDIYSQLTDVVSFIGKNLDRL